MSFALLFIGLPLGLSLLFGLSAISAVINKEKNHVLLILMSAITLCIGMTFLAVLIAG